MYYTQHFEAAVSSLYRNVDSFYFLFIQTVYWGSRVLSGFLLLLVGFFIFPRRRTSRVNYTISRQ